MIYIKRGETNDIVTTCSLNKEYPGSPYYLFSFTHILSKEVVRFYPQNISTHTNRYDEFRFIEGVNENLNAVPPIVTFPYEGQYYYSIFEMVNSGSTNPSTAYNKVEEGRAYVSGNTQDVSFYTEFISSNEDNDNYIFLSDEEERP